MKIKQLLEGAEPKMPGAPRGIQIMTPQQFVAKAGDEPEAHDELASDTFSDNPEEVGENYEPNDPRDGISPDEIVPNKFYITNRMYKDQIDGPFDSFQEADEWAYDKYASVSAKEYENNIEI